MQILKVTPEMRSLIGGAFYPTHFSLIMYPTEHDAKEIARRLCENYFNIEDIFLITPETVFSEIQPTVDTSNKPLPSMGSDGNIAREIIELAERGHFGLLIRTNDEEAISVLRERITNTNFSFAKAYHSLAIEDL